MRDIEDSVVTLRRDLEEAFETIETRDGTIKDLENEIENQECQVSTRNDRIDELEEELLEAHRELEKYHTTI